MLMAFLAMNGTGMKTHSYPSYGAFICGNQVQLDVRRDNYLRIINAFNKIEAVKAYLFSNSEFSAEVWDTKIARDIFWEESLHGYYKENVGIYPKDYQSEEEFFNNLARTAIFTAIREGKSYYFKPVCADLALDLSNKTSNLEVWGAGFNWNPQKFSIEKVNTNDIGVHKFSTWTTTKNATCTQVGTKSRKCTVCGKTETQTIAKTGHKSVTDKTISATCTTDGKTEGSHCSVCGAVIRLRIQ